MSALNNSALMGASGSTGYQISRSVRLRSSASAYFSRTPASAGSLTTWTWSAWVKRGALGSNNALFGVSNNSDKIWFSSDQLSFYIGAGAAYTWWSAALFRDPSAWYHIVVVLDTTNATSTDRVRVFVNGVRATAGGSTTYPTLNYSGCNFNTAVSTNIGRGDNTNNYYLDGYLTEINFIDGQALTPASFGETNAVTGVWQPKKYTGTYGTNGFYINFSDNSSNTATTIGKDYSGNGNNWTPNNISVTSGATYDSMLDVPTQWADGGNGRGNYAVVNPLSKGTSQTSVIDGNLYAIPTSGASNWGTVFSSIAIPTSGKWYMEATAQVYAGSGNSSSFGVVDATSFIPTNTAILYQFTTGEGFDGILAHLFSDYVSPISDGVQGTNVTGLTGTSINLMLALDVDNGKVYAGYNGTWLNSGNPAGNTGEIATRTFSANDVVAGSTGWNGTNDQSQYYNFGQRPFAYTPPSGFKALNTLNLPTPTILKGNQYFDATTYTGNGGTQSIVNSGSMQPDFVWVKDRTAANNHILANTVAGITNFLNSNTTNAESSTAGLITAVNTNGFSVGSVANVNANGNAYVGWQWKEGATQGFDIVLYTGNGANRTIAHNLGVAPSMMIVKNRTNGTTNWRVWHSALAGTEFLELNTTAAKATGATQWNSTVPTSTVFSLGIATATNGSGDSFVNYLFAEVAGFSRFGTYTGNGSADGPFVFCGFRPRFILVKNSAAVTNWTIVDTARSTYNATLLNLGPNQSNAENSFVTGIDITANGFKIRDATSNWNDSSNAYIFAAFAENPFKNALAR